MVQLSFTVESNSLIKRDAVTFLQLDVGEVLLNQLKQRNVLNYVKILQINVVLKANRKMEQSCRDRRQTQHFVDNWKLNQYYTYLSADVPEKIKQVHHGEF